MLNNADYIDWCLQLGLAEITRATITAARSRNSCGAPGAQYVKVERQIPTAALSN